MSSIHVRAEITSDAALERSQYRIHPSGRWFDLLHPRNPQIYRSTYGCAAVLANRVSDARFYGSFRRHLRDRLRISGAVRTAHQARVHSTSVYNSDSIYDDQNSGIVPPRSRFLVHGKRRENGFCDDDESAFPDQRRRRALVSRCFDMETALCLSLNRLSTMRTA